MSVSDDRSYAAASPKGVRIIPIPNPVVGRLALPCVLPRLCPSALLAIDSSPNEDDLHSGEGCRRCEAVHPSGVGDEREDEAEEK